MDCVRILFLHGWHSTPGGVKPTFLAQHGHEVFNPALPDDNFDAAVAIAQADFDRGRPDVDAAQMNCRADAQMNCPFGSHRVAGRAACV